MLTCNLRNIIQCQQQYYFCAGHAAALTDYLVLRDALCGVTFALSLVALLLVSLLSVLTKLCPHFKHSHTVTHHNTTAGNTPQAQPTTGEMYAIVDTGRSNKDRINLKKNFAYGPTGQQQQATMPGGASSQQNALGAMYDDVILTTSEQIELTSNLAYGPGQCKTDASQAARQTSPTDSDGYEEV